MTVKQVIVIRKDLKMRRGKEIAQGAHASMAWLVKRIVDRDDHQTRTWRQFWAWIWAWISGKGQSSRICLSEAEMAWMEGSFAKIVCQVDTEEELLDIQRKAREAGVISTLITDSGFTEFNGVPTNTAVAVGPDEEERIKPITGGLKLY